MCLPNYLFFSIYKKAAKLDHTWVANCWIRDLGLSQYCGVFDHHLIDGRLLNHLTKKDLEKQCGITRKFHHASIVHGIELLRIINFDKEVQIYFYYELEFIVLYVQ